MSHQPNIVKKIKKTTKKAPERYQSLSKEKKEKSDNLVVTDTKICQKMKHKSMLSIKKYIIKGEKKRSYNYKKLFFIFFKK